MTDNKVTKRPPLMSLDEALSAVLKEVSVLTQTEWVNTFEADGRVLSHDLVSGLHVPPQDNSSMDGYAVRVEDVVHSGASLKVTQRIPAGQHGHALNPGEAARIFTGAPIPPGANAVVMQEDTQVTSTDNAAVENLAWLYFLQAMNWSCPAMLRPRTCGPVLFTIPTGFSYVPCLFGWGVK